jgi:DNA-binding NtrC family response regulator
MVITDFIIGEYLLGGQEVLDTVRLVQPDCPVILLTGYFKDLDRQTTQDQAFSYIVQKPVDFSKISQIVSRFLKKKLTADFDNKNKNKNKKSEVFDHDY